MVLALSKDQQLKVVQAAEEERQSCLVIACPGSGKTRLLVYLAPRLEGKVLVLTHTKDARRVLRDRGVEASTVHSHCFWSLGPPIFDTFDQLLWYRGDGSYDWVLVDEAHDLSYEQYQVVRSLGKRYIMVGDPCQAIFNFSGAWEDVFSAFREDFRPVELGLTYNFRSGQEVVDRLESIYPRGMEAMGGRGDGPFDLSVIVRTRLEAEGISQLLEKRHIIHSLVTGDYPRKADRNLEALSVMTAHCTKGREFTGVLVRPWEVVGAEETRLYYVACSRARGFVEELYSVEEIIEWVDCWRGGNGV